MKYYSEQAVATLIRDIPKNLDWYRYPDDEVPVPEGVKQPIRETNLLQEVNLGELNTGRDQSHTSDPKNALIVYSKLKHVRPQEAADQRLWTYLCHVQCAGYVAKRWLPKDTPNHKAIHRVYDHFFASGVRTIIRSNGLSRLWWLGYIAHKIDEKDPFQFLDILLHKQDLRVALIERPSVSMNLTTLSAIYKIMQESWSAKQEQAPLFQRDVFRDWMKKINRKGGVILLDALSSKDLNTLLNNEATDAIKENAKDPKPEGPADPPLIFRPVPTD